MKAKKLPRSQAIQTTQATGVKRKYKDSAEFAVAVGRALRRSARVARKVARMHGTPIYVWRDGKVVALKP